MDNETLHQHAHDYRRVAQAIQFLSDHYRRQPDLAEVAASVHLSPYHFQRLFKRWAGVTPLQFRQYLTLNYAQARLAAADSVLDTALAAGLSGPGRLHDLFVNITAMTPGEYKNGGQGLTLRYGRHDTPFGPAVLVVSDRGLVALRFADDDGVADDGVADDGSADVLVELRAEWPAATWIKAAAETAPLAARIFDRPVSGAKPFHLHLKGTNFQIQVWQALLRIPAGALVSYGDLAQMAGRAGASRAVAGAVARNPVAYLIPCHRVIRASGALHGYRWGATRKQALVGWEAARWGALTPAAVSAAAD